MRMSLSVELPRERASVPLVRHLASRALRELDVITEVIDDIEIALSEVCTNVIDHAEVGDSYEVELTVKNHECEISVVDTGCGFDAVATDDGDDTDHERGRGLPIVRAVMDEVAVESEADQGTVVTLRKRLEYQAEFEGS
jgi:anti-sigma regulatory factor (Ser/Thr protein kinase)